jgi:4-hydroxybenzoate polyprenyltransferase
MKNLARSLRLDQWIKNSFVLAPLIFSRHLTEADYLIKALVYTLSYCLVSSAVYLFNDVADRERDRAHPEKRNRPVASGAMRVKTAILLSLLLALGAAALCAFFPWPAGFVLLIYVVNNLLYTAFLKRIVVLDVILIAVGFVLRVIGGAEAIEVEASVWLIMCTFLISLFLGFCKRKQELLILQSRPAEHRAVLGDYNLNYLDQMISVVSACTVLSYALYTVSDDTVAKFGTDRLIYSVPFVIYGVFRYMYHVNVLQTQKTTSQILAGDKSLLLNIFLWLGVSITQIYFYTP